MKICSICKIEKPLSDFYKNASHRLGVRERCKLCCIEDNKKTYHNKLKFSPEYKAGRKEYSYQWHLDNKDERNKTVRDRRKNWRAVCIEHYGGKCDCCGENRVEFLAIDHVNGGGRKHRQSLSSSDITRWIIKNNFPAGFRILCHNCNQSLGAYGYCPHQKEKKDNQCSNSPTSPT